MPDNPAQIYDTLERALAKRDSVGVLRTALRWWNAFDDRAALLRAASEALVARGRDERASQVLFEAARVGAGGGSPLAMADAALRLEALRESADALWDEARELLGAPPDRSAIPPALGLAAPMTNIPHDLDELVDRLVGLASRSAPADGRLAAPLLDDLGADGIELLRQAGTRAVPDGAPLLGPDDAIAWVLSGGISDAQGARGAREGTLLVAARAEERRRASCPTRLLTVSERAFAAWRDDERVVRFLARSLRRAYAVDALSRCGWFEALSPGGRQRVLRAATPIVSSAGAVIEAGSTPAGLFILVRGRADLVDRDGRVLVKVQSIQAGDVVGEGALLSGKPARLELRVESPAAFLLIPRREARALNDEEPSARQWLAALASQRREDIERLDTGEVVLLDE